MGNNLPVEEVHDRREVELAVSDTELGHVRDPLLIRGGGLELPVQQVRRGSALFALIGVVALPPPDLAGQPECAHQLQHGLLREYPALLEQFRVDTAVPVPGVALLKDACERGFELCLRVRGEESCLVIEERGPGQPGNVQKNFQPVLGLESDDSADF